MHEYLVEWYPYQQSCHFMLPRSFEFLEFHMGSFRSSACSFIKSNVFLSYQIKKKMNCRPSNLENILKNIITKSFKTCVYNSQHPTQQIRQHVQQPKGNSGVIRSSSKPKYFCTSIRTCLIFLTSLNYQTFRDFYISPCSIITYFTRRL